MVDHRDPIRQQPLCSSQGIEIVMKDQCSKVPAFTEHALRSRVLAEVHARPSEPIEGAERILHFAFTTDQAAAIAAREALNVFCVDHACPTPASDAKQHRVELPGAVLRWEHHGEFMTYSWEFSQKTPGSELIEVRRVAFEPRSSELLGFMRLLPQPGPLLVAADLHLLPEGQTDESWSALFEPNRLSASEVVGGAAIAATDFHPDASGFVRLLVLSRRLTAREAGTLVRWLLEVETYRTLALLGLPEAELSAHQFAGLRPNCLSSFSRCAKGKDWRRAVNYFTV